MRIPVWALCLAALTGWSGFLHAETVGSIGVYVHDLDTDEPITSAKAILTREGDGPWSDTTNSRGNAVFRNMPEGEYVLSVFAEGYASAAQTLEVIFGPNLVFHTALGLQVSETGAIEARSMGRMWTHPLRCPAPR